MIVPKSHTGNIHVFDEKHLKSSDSYYFEPGLYPSIMDTVAAMNSLVQVEDSHSENCIAVEVPRRTQKDKIYMAKEVSGPAVFNTALGQFFGSNVGKECRVMLRSIGPYKAGSAHDILRI